MVSTGPSTASGGMTTLTREPSGRRASHSGSASSTRRPSGARIRSIAWRRSASAAKATLGRLEPAGALDPDGCAAVDHDLVDRRVLEQRLERPEPERPLRHPRDELFAGGRVEDAGLTVHQRADPLDRRGRARRARMLRLGEQALAQRAREVLEVVSSRPAPTVIPWAPRRRSPGARASRRSSRAKDWAAAR